MAALGNQLSTWMAVEKDWRDQAVRLWDEYQDPTYRDCVHQIKVAGEWYTLAAQIAYVGDGLAGLVTLEGGEMAVKASEIQAIRRVVPTRA